MAGRSGPRPTSTRASASLGEASEREEGEEGESRCARAIFIVCGAWSVRGMCGQLPGMVLILRRASIGHERISIKTYRTPIGMRTPYFNLG